METGVLNVGDVMYDASLFYRAMARKKSAILKALSLTRKAYGLATCHRAENIDDPRRLAAIVEGLATLAQIDRIIFPLHPGTRKVLQELGLFEKLGDVEVLEPVSFLDMMQLEELARVIVTDSGGVPCITMRDETEWVETVEMGGNVLAGANCNAMLTAYGMIGSEGVRHAVRDIYGDGNASELIVSKLREEILPSPSIAGTKQVNIEPRMNANERERKTTS